jgi:ABC-type lipoprotein release transport system permease subunit
VKPEEIDARFAAYIHDHVRLSRAGSALTMRLQPLTSLHFTNDFHRGDDGDSWRKPYLPTLYAMMGVAMFILLIAAINFVNLSTAQSMSRAKEVGVRRVMGGRQWSIRWQFLTETLVVVLFSVLIAILLVNPVLALFHDYVPEGIRFHVLRWSTLGFLAVMTTLTTALAGSYPAWVLSAYNPVKQLKGPVTGGHHWGLRRGLIVFQFVISLVFIIGSLVIGRQIAFMNQADKGFNTDRVLTMVDWSDPPAKLQAFANSLKDIPGVEKVLMEGTPPMGFAQNMDVFSFRPTGNEMHNVSAHMGNDEYIPFYGMRLVAGRNMLPGDSLRELVVNTTMTRLMGCRRPQEAIGRILYSQTPTGAIGTGHPVVGVVADFHVSSFHEPIPPVVIENVPERKQNIAVRLAPGEQDPKAVKAVVDQLEARWKKQFPADRPFRSAFLDESISRLFDQERKTAWLMNRAMGVTLLISCMGLFGLGLFTVRKRAREIGIRKVLGASVLRIVAMLSRDFALLVVLAFFIASPVAWLFAHRWLQDFEYRTTLAWWIFAGAGMAALALTLLTVGLQAVRAALVNPAEVLRSE